MQTRLQISKHDQLQLELKAEYQVDRNVRQNEYSVDVYFFLPRNLAVNELTYNSKEFYNDFSEYIRFKTPEVSPAELASPENALWRKLDAAKETTPEECRKYIKLFCSVYRSAIRDGSKKLLKTFPLNTEKLHVHITAACKILELFRCRRQNFAANPEIAEFFALADEYASIVLSWHCSRICKRLEQEENPCSRKLQENLVKIIHAEDSRRLAAGTPSVPSPATDNSLVIYRESILKKTMASILFLNMETRRDGLIVETFLMGLAAAVAMIFVTAVAFLWQGLYLQEFSFSFFCVWVAAYMFKDRIKFLLQNYFATKRSRYSYDYKQKIMDNLNNEVGILREGFRYINPAKLADDIAKVRNKTRLSRTETGSLSENIMLYRKKIELKSSSCSSFFNEFDVKGVVNICRMNIKHWLNKMDNPVRTVYTSDGKSLLPLPANRDYHVNIVIKLSSKGKKDTFSRYRLILSRNGIRRLESFNF